MPKAAHVIKVVRPHSDMAASSGSAQASDEETEDIAMPQREEPAPAAEWQSEAVHMFCVISERGSGCFAGATEDHH